MPHASKCGAVALVAECGDDTVGFVIMRRRGCAATNRWEWFVSSQVCALKLPRLLAAAISASAFSLALSLRITRSADMPRMRAAAIQKIADVIARSKSVSFLTGPGVSVSAGIPDFRSPGGMYDTLRPELLTATDAQRRAMSVDPTASG